MNTCVLAVAGPIASGKTTLSIHLSETLGWRRTAFGDYVRGVAHTKGLDGSLREVLQSIGAELIADGWEVFCRSVLENAGWHSGEPLIIEGVRHEQCLSTLRMLVHPLPCYLIWIRVSDSVRMARLLTRGIDTPILEKTESHSTEEQVGSVLQSLADLTVDGDPEPYVAVQEIVSFLTQL